MSEKVLGFKAKDAEINHKRFGTRKGYWIKANRLVPVRLKSESVSLTWVEKWCKDEIKDTQQTRKCAKEKITLSWLKLIEKDWKLLLSTAKKQAVEKK